jgi:hypothetical protein
MTRSAAKANPPATYVVDPCDTRDGGPVDELGPTFTGVIAGGR